MSNNNWNTFERLWQPVVYQWRRVSKDWKKPYARRNRRNTFTKAVLWVMIGAMALSYGIMGLLSRFSSNKGGDEAVTVNDQKISFGAYQRRVSAKREQLSMMQQQFSQIGFDVQELNLNPNEWALDSLVEDSLLNSVAQKFHFSLDPVYVSLKLVDPYYGAQELSEFIPPYVFFTQQLSMEDLSIILRNKGISLREFEYFIERNLQKNLIKDLVKNAAYVPNFLMEHEYVQKHALKNYSILSLKLDTYLKKIKETPVSDDALKVFFDKEQRKYRVPEKRSGVVWAFDAGNYSIPVSDNEIREYYEDNKSKFIETTAKANVRRILFKTGDLNASDVMARAVELQSELSKDPKLFSKKAKELSEDTDTKSKDGETGFFVRKDKDPAFGKAAFRLKEKYDISPVIQTKDGIEILQLIERKKMVYKSLESVNSDIRSLVMNRKFKNVFGDDIEDLVMQAYADSLAVETFVKKKHAKKSEISMLERDESAQSQRLFRLKKGDFSYYRDGNTGILVQLADVHQSYVPDLSSVADVVAEDWYKKQAADLLQKDLKSIQGLAVDGSLKDIAQEFNGHLSTVSFISTDDKKKEKFLKEGIPVEHMAQLEHVGASQTVSLGNTGYFVQLDSLDSLKEEDKEKNKEELEASLYQNISMHNVESFIASLRRIAKIDINKKTVRNDHL